MGVLIRKFLRDIRVPLIVVVVIVVGFQAIWYRVSHRTTTQLSPFIATMTARAGLLQKHVLQQIFNGPGKILESISGGDRIAFDRAQDMLTVGYVHPLMLIVFGLWGVGRASGAIAGELDRGTMELLLAQPIARWRIIAAHLTIDAIAIPLIAISMWAGNWLGYGLVGPFDITPEEAQKTFGDLPIKVEIDYSLFKLDLWAFLPGAVNVAALIFATSGLTMAISSAGRFRNRVLGWSVLVVLLQFVANVVGQLWDGAAFLRPFTLFYYYQPQQIILHQKWTVDLLNGLGSQPIPVNVVAVLIGVGVVGYAIAFSVFTRRDLPAPL